MRNIKGCSFLFGIGITAGGVKLFHRYRAFFLGKDKGDLQGGRDRLGDHNTTAFGGDNLVDLLATETPREILTDFFHQ